MEDRLRSPRLGGHVAIEHCTSVLILSYTMTSCNPSVRIREAYLCPGLDQLRQEVLEGVRR